MSTNKNKISAYLDEHDFLLLEDLAKDHRISKSQAVILAIRSFAGNPVSPRILSSSITDRVELLESKIEKLTPVIESVKLALKDISSRIDALESVHTRQKKRVD